VSAEGEAVKDAAVKDTVVKLVLATHNEGKLAELREIVASELGEAAANFDIVTAGSLGIADPIETGVTFEENALLKARFVARETGLPAIADDSGLIVDILGAAPGILSARWAGVHGDDAANNALLLAQLADIPDSNRAARFECVAALVIPTAEGLRPGKSGMGEITKRGTMRGTLLRAPHGSDGFGYDPIFVPDEQEIVPGSEPLTSAQMTREQKNAISHRGKAFRALMPEVEHILTFEK
jgi:XTP/dITP diphosphohydrolase